LPNISADDKAVLLAVAERSGPEFRIRFAEPSSVAVLAGDLDIGECNVGPADTAPKRVTMALCFLGRMQGVLVGTTSRSLVTSLELVDVRAAPEFSPAASMVSFRQRFEGVLATKSRASVYFSDGHVVAYAGRLLDVAQVAARTPLPESLLDALAEGYAGRDVVRQNVQYDEYLRDFVVEYRSLGTEAEVLRLRERSGELLGTRAANYRASKPVKGYVYASSLAPVGSPPSQTTYTVPMSVTPASGSQYTHLLSGDGGVPYVVRYMANAASGGGCTTVAQVDAFQNAATSAATPWLAVTSGSNFRMANAYVLVNLANSLRLDPAQGLVYNAQASIPFRLVVADCLSADAFYVPDGGTGGEMQLTGLSNPTWSNLSTILHEYGHYIHDRYNGAAGSHAIAEGFADTMPARWLLYASENRGEYSGLHYLSAIDRSLIQSHGSLLVNGEYRLDIAAYYPDPTCTPDEEDINTSYSCGRVISFVYWELVWDQCRTGYGTCSIDQDIIQTGGYASNARVLANNAFAYALSHLAPGDIVADYFEYVSEYYLILATYSGISEADYQRVLDAMAHHCVGYNRRCGSGFHKLPGSVLPSSYTHKGAHFREAEAGTLGGDAQGVLESASNGALVWLQSGSWVTYTFTIPVGTTGNYDVKLAAKYYAFPASSASVLVSGYGGQSVAVANSNWQWLSTTAPYFLVAGTTYSITVAQTSGNVDLDAVVLVRR
jgi:hypothetical protein